MYKRQVFKEKDPEELIAPPGRLPEGQTLRTASERERKIWSTRSVGIVGQTSLDPNSPSIMAFRADYRVPAIVLEREGTTRKVNVWSDPAKITAGINFEANFAEIRQSLDKVVF